MSASAFQLLEKSLMPVADSLTREAAEKIAGLRASPEAQSRIDELASKCNEGSLTSEERAEYEMFVWVGQYLSKLQAKARTILKAA